MQEEIKQQVESYIKLLNITLSDNPKHFELSDWIPNCIECLQFALDNKELLIEKPSLYADTLSTISLLYSWIVEDKSWAYIELRQKFRTVYTPEQVGNAFKILAERLKETRDEVCEYQDSLSVQKRLDEISEAWNKLCGVEPNEPTIDQLKKQIKYSKNPLEVKILNKKLNKMYKDMKRR